MNRRSGRGEKVTSGGETDKDKAEFFRNKLKKGGEYEKEEAKES